MMQAAPVAGMHRVHDGPHATKHRAREFASSRKLSSRLAVAAFAGILVFYSTTLRSTGRVIGAIHHAPNATAVALVVGDEPGVNKRSEESVEVAVAGSTVERSDGGAEQSWPAKMPNEGRTKKEGFVGVRVDTGVRSVHYGHLQRQHQEWLTQKAQQLSSRLEVNGPTRVEGAKRSKQKGLWLTGRVRGMKVGRKTQNVDQGESSPGESGSAAQTELEDRIERVNVGAHLWGETYAPPIEPTRRHELIDKWTGKTWSPPESASQVDEGKPETQVNKSETQVKPPMGRILYVISSFDRGERLGREFRKQSDKMDYILMMLDEMREACEVGFSPEVHLLAAWDPSVMVHLVQDRLFCERTGEDVPFSYQEYPHSVGNKLSAKHRIYMKDKLELFDIFLQVEDDMVLTLNHILLYQEESELLDNRMISMGTSAENVFVPGFIRVEPGMGKGGEIDGDTWVEWEIMLSRFFPVKVAGAGTYIALRKSTALNCGGEYGENNQGLWIATQEQLRKLSENKKCQYLNFDEDTARGNPETHSGSIQMFSVDCGFHKVFPATHFEDFLVHHRANNKAGRRGESIPGVPISMLREWAEQFIRDEGLLVAAQKRR